MKRIPAVLLLVLLGTTLFAQTKSKNNNPAFSPDEKALQNGVKTEVQIILDYLNH